MKTTPQTAIRGVASVAIINILARTVDYGKFLVSLSTKALLYLILSNEDIRHWRVTVSNEILPRRDKP
ncbi:MAG: hypothetical protein WC899_03420 [bacterium]